MDDLLNNLASLFADPPKNSDPENLLNQFLDLLEQGHVRCVNRNHDGWIVDERPQRILRGFDLGLGDNHRLFARRHFRFRFDDVDRRDGADLDARARVAQ